MPYRNMLKRLSFITLGLIVALSVSGQSVNPVIESAGDVELSDLITDLSAKQTDYFNQKGRYWQGIRTHAITDKSITLNKKVKPTDQKESWEDMKIALPEKSRYVYEVIPYETPKGHGYTITLLTKINGDVYTKTYNYGPEAEREHDWQIQLTE